MGRFSYDVEKPKMLPIKLSAEKCRDVWCRNVRSDGAVIGSNCGNEVWWGLRGETTPLQPPKGTGFVRVQIMVWGGRGRGVAVRLIQGVHRLPVLFCFL